MTTIAADDRISAPTFGRLLGTEFRRLAARRFSRVLLGLCVIGYLVAVAFVWQAHAKVTPADIAQATTQRDEQIAAIKQQVTACLKIAGNTEEQCGTVPTDGDFPIDQFLSNDPFRPGAVEGYTTAVGAAVALAGFILAATFIGAEWSSKNVIAWLFWEPRRLRLMWAKLLALSSVVLVLSAIAQVVWGLTARLLLNSRGLAVSSLGTEAATFWPDMLRVQIRAGLLVVPVVLLGFALANLIRNTAAALGVAFVYFVVVESVIRSISPSLQPYLFMTSVGAWVSRGGVTVYGKLQFDRAQGSVAPEEIHVSNLQGGLTLMVYAAVILVVSLALFRRRDIT